MAIWNKLGRLAGGRHKGPKTISWESKRCPKCKGKGVYHLLAAPKYMFCDELDCGWRSCMVCKITWSERTGSIIPVLRSPVPPA